MCKENEFSRCGIPQRLRLVGLREGRGKGARWKAVWVRESGEEKGKGWWKGGIFERS